MIRTAAEPWAQDNSRLQEYVRRQVHKEERGERGDVDGGDGKESRYRQMLDTGLRLGLTCTRYEWPRVRKELKVGKVDLEQVGAGEMRNQELKGLPGLPMRSNPLTNSRPGTGALRNSMEHSSSKEASLKVVGVGSRPGSCGSMVTINL